jgi:RNA polymerase sigma-70 factor, ECF subfamily
MKYADFEFLWGKPGVCGAYSNRRITNPNDRKQDSKWICIAQIALHDWGAMRLGITRLVLGSLSAGAVSFGDAIDEAPATAAPAETSFLSQLRQRLLSDEALAEHLQSGDADALTVLFERHGPRLLGVARRILRNQADAEDAVQQVFLDVFRSIRQFDPEKGSFKTWLFIFGYQRIFNCRRSLTAHRFFDTDQFNELLPELTRETESPSSFSLTEAAVLIEQVLSRLQPRQRRTIELVYYEGFTAEEISVRTGESVRVVRHNLYRGLEKLRKAMRGSSPSGRDDSKGGEK